MLTYIYEGVLEVFFTILNERLHFETLNQSSGKINIISVENGFSQKQQRSVRECSPAARVTHTRRWAMQNSRRAVFCKKGSRTRSIKMRSTASDCNNELDYLLQQIAGTIKSSTILGLSIASSEASRAQRSLVGDVNSPLARRPARCGSCRNKGADRGAASAHSATRVFASRGSLRYSTHTTPCCPFECVPHLELVTPRIKPVRQP